MGLIDDISSSMNKMSLTNQMQERGFKPVFRIITQNSFDDEELGPRVLINTVPLDVRRKLNITLRTDYAMIEEDFSTYGKDIMDFDTITAEATGLKEQLGSIKNDTFYKMGEVKDRALEGCMVDMATSQQQKYNLANIIFQNPMRKRPTGDGFYGTDFMKVGFPIWVYMGYVDQAGNVVRHPFSDEPVNDIPLVFAGFVGALKQEINEAGDRMVMQGVGYKWYLDNITLGDRSIGPFYIDADNTTLEQAIKHVFEWFYVDSGMNDGMVPDVIRRTLRLGNNGLPVVRYIYGASKSKKPVLTGNQRSIKIGNSGDSSYLDVLGTLEQIYQVDIFWDVNGYVLVHGRTDPYTRIQNEDRTGFVKEQMARTHDAVLGGNVRNWEFGVDAENTAPNLVLRVRRAGSGEPAEIFRFDGSDMKKLVDDWRVETSKPAKDVYWIESAGGKKNVVVSKVDITESGLEDDNTLLFGAKSKVVDVLYHHTTGKSVDKPEDETRQQKYQGIKDWPAEALQALARRVYHWGMRGSCMIMGNANVKVGDLIRVTDVRTYTSPLNTNLDAASDVIKSIADKAEEVISSSSAEVEEAIPLGIESTQDVYYIWKVRHYVGPNGFWTKMWFIKQRDAYMTMSSSLRALKRQSGIGGIDNIEDEQ